MSVLTATIVGFLGQDATTNVVSGQQVVNLNIAHSEKWTDAQGNKKEKTTWVQGNFWTDRTGLIPYLKKGTLIWASGTPEARNYTNRNGEVVAQLSLRVTNVQLLGGNKENNNSNNTASTNTVSSDIPQDDSGVPF